jgi:hypothetical protein
MGSPVNYAKFIYNDLYECEIEYRIFKKIQILIYDSLKLNV